MSQFWNKIACLEICVSCAFKSFLESLIFCFLNDRQRKYFVNFSWVFNESYTQWIWHKRRRMKGDDLLFKLIAKWLQKSSNYCSYNGGQKLNVLRSIYNTLSKSNSWFWNGLILCQISLQRCAFIFLLGINLEYLQGRKAKSSPLCSFFVTWLLQKNTKFWKLLV